MMSSIDKDYEGCKKNPGHKCFVSIDKCINLNEEFMQRLPNVYHGNKTIIKHLIQSLADLTVHVTADGTMGTGFIEKVTLIADDGTILEQKCQCKKCKKRTNPKSVMGQLYVRTASHVISNEKDISALKDTVCRLFYDFENSEIVEVVALKVEKQNANDTVCLVCSTCDVQVLQKVLRTLIDFKNINRTVSRKYITIRNPEDIVVIIVSHPHGLCKHLTIGTRLPPDGASLTKYQADTCSGSSGANVFQLGGLVDTVPLVHIGSCKEGDVHISFANPYRELNVLKPETFFQHLLCYYQKFVKYLFPNHNSNGV